MLSMNEGRKFEQRQLFDMLRCYDPWGRAGGGAPITDVRRKDLLSRYIYPQCQSRDSNKERLRPPNRPKHRPHLSFHNSEMKQNEYPVEPPPRAYEVTKYIPTMEEQQQYDSTFPKVNAQKVWSSNPWEGRGPWGSRGPGGHPWRPAAHVGKNFHHSMGWTTDSTFRFPNISGENKENISRLLDVDFRKRKFKPEKIPPINGDKAPSGRAPEGGATSWKPGGTPNGHLMQMTGGIELVPLMRARAWTHKLKPSESDLYSIGTQPYGIFHRE